jgi:hypothetical protein
MPSIPPRNIGIDAGKLDSIMWEFRLCLYEVPVVGVIIQVLALEVDVLVSIHSLLLMPQAEDVSYRNKPLVKVYMKIRRSYPAHGPNR